MSENNPMGSDATKHDVGIAYRRLKAFCDASEFADADVIMSHSQYSDDLTVKGKVNLVFGDICDVLSAIKTQSAEIERLRAVIVDLAVALNENLDDDPCWTDHHGYCQAHHLDDTNEDGCRVENGRKLYDKIKAEFIEGDTEQALKGGA
ncbi:hypothetical protein [Thalassospira aquimaris]|uniref:Uncharacterized protein n=1 Tax=Thalassospira aquimaris TaxID=3037796 RepID=A0ABT6GIP8_9PROT|nr:hypothetical protein [Thalassospira sp. FZY0004]MDG4721604.1 hypothetical protein [Thalassospira sp. FZY0004]